jgi:hypothetical protein
LSGVVADLLANFRANTDPLKQDLTKASSMINNFGKTLSTAGSKAGSLAMGLLGTEAGIRLLERGFNATVGTIKQVMASTSEYSDQIRQLTRDTGMSVEQSAKMLMIADDSQVSFSNLTTAMKFAIKDGVLPNIAGIAELSDKYIALNDPLLKSQMLIKQFGRNGLEMSKILELGGSNIIKLGNTAEDFGLVMSNSDIQNIRDYEIAINEAGDAGKGLGVQLGIWLSPKLKDLANSLADTIKGGRESTIQFDAARQAYKDMGLNVAEADRILAKHVVGILDDTQVGEAWIGALGKENYYLNEQGVLVSKIVAKLPTWASAGKDLFKSIGITKALTEEEQKNVDTAHDKAGILFINNSLLDNGVGIVDQYMNAIKDLQVQETALGNAIGETNSKKEKQQLLDQLNKNRQTQQTTTMEYKSKLSGGLADILTGGIPVGGATPTDVMGLMNAMGLLDNKLYGVNSALYDIADGFDDSVDGAINLKDWTEQDYIAMGKLKQQAFDAMSSMPKGGKYTIYYDIVMGYVKPPTPPYTPPPGSGGSNSGKGYMISQELPDDVQPVVDNINNIIPAIQSAAGEYINQLGNMANTANVVGPVVGLKGVAENISASFDTATKNASGDLAGVGNMARGLNGLRSDIWIFVHTIQVGGYNVSIPGGSNPSTNVPGHTYYGGGQAANGANFTVPAGYPNDSFPMFVESGEKVIVIPRNKVNQIPKFGYGVGDPYFYAPTSNTPRYQPGIGYGHVINRGDPTSSINNPAGLSNPTSSINNPAGLSNPTSVLANLFSSNSDSMQSSVTESVNKSVKESINVTIAGLVTAQTAKTAQQISTISGRQQETAQKNTMISGDMLAELTAIRKGIENIPIAVRDAVTLVAD